MTDGLELAPRLRRASDALAFAALSVPLGVVGLLAVAGIVVGGVLSAAVVGLPVLLLAVAGGRAVARLGRQLGNRLLETHLPPVQGPARPSGSPWRRATLTLGDRRLWRLVAFLVALPLLGGAALVVGLAPIVATASLLTLGVEGIGGLGSIEYVGPLTLNPVSGILLCLLAAPSAVLAVAVLDALFGVLGAAVRALLAPRSAVDGPVRELLAESLGDRTLSVAYWLPDRGRFVDEAGHEVELPEAGSGRTWTAVERDGRRVAAIVHDAALDASAELVHAAAAGAALAIDNERLKADLRARVEELRHSRLRIVEAGDAARRRLERDLHDGAQQQLVSLALDLRILKARLKDRPEDAAVVDGITEKLSVALSELRELARGIHPAILTDRGLAPAVTALADRVPVPVEEDVDLGERLPPAIEAAAYFVVAEALTNVAKYAQAEQVAVAIRREDGTLVVRVDDDGVGGADLRGGTGLRGLLDRVAALDGTLEVVSPPGNGTRLCARIPLPG